MQNRTFNVVLFSIVFSFLSLGLQAQQDTIQAKATDFWSQMQGAATKAKVNQAAELEAQANAILTEQQRSKLFSQNKGKWEGLISNKVTAGRQEHAAMLQDLAEAQEALRALQETGLSFPEWQQYGQRLNELESVSYDELGRDSVLDVSTFEVVGGLLPAQKDTIDKLQERYYLAVFALQEAKALQVEVGEIDTYLTEEYKAYTTAQDTYLNRLESMQSDLQGYQQTYSAYQENLTALRNKYDNALRSDLIAAVGDSVFALYKSAYEQVLQKQLDEFAPDATYTFATPSYAKYLQQTQIEELKELDFKVWQITTGTLPAMKSYIGYMQAQISRAEQVILQLRTANSNLSAAQQKLNEARGVILSQQPLVVQARTYFDRGGRDNLEKALQLAEETIRQGKDVSQAAALKKKIEAILNPTETRNFLWWRWEVEKKN